MTHRKPGIIPPDDDDLKIERANFVEKTAPLFLVGDKIYDSADLQNVIYLADELWLKIQQHRRAIWGLRDSQSSFFPSTKG